MSRRPESHTRSSESWRTGAIGERRPNPSVKRSAAGRPPGPGWRYTVHGTFSPARAWRPAVGARLART
jgi:hypothetical protein